MNPDKKIILCGAGLIGRRALEYFGKERVEYFADSNNAKTEFWGVPVISFAELIEIESGYNIVISANYDNTKEIKALLSQNGILDTYLFGDCIDYSSLPVSEDIVKFKNKHAGEQCFLIGNGPSLRASDLETLHKHKQITFGCNAIFRIFGETNWRPDYYMAFDVGVTNLWLHEILARLVSSVVFLPRPEQMTTSDESAIRDLLNTHNNIRHLYSVYQSPENYGFSNDISRYVSPVGTVMCAMMQAAVYMGFSKMYLIGVDHSLGTYGSTNTQDMITHFYREDKNELERVKSELLKHRPIVSWEGLKAENEACYTAAKKYMDGNGTKVINATRGGKLEYFDRVDFDSIDWSKQ